MTKIETILWRSIWLPGHEYCQLIELESGWQLEGMTLLAQEGQPSRLEYSIICDAAWQTLSARIEGWMGNNRLDIRLHIDSKHRWYANDVEQPQVIGSIDLDLNFSPATNLLPIRRLKLAVGEQAEITAAWLRFPGFALEPLPQRYTRLEDNLYRYESGGGSFVVDLRVDSKGLVLDYPGIWVAEAMFEG